MTNQFIPNRIAELFQKFAFLKGSVFSVAIWPIASLLLGILMWAGMNAELREDQRTVEVGAQEEAHLLARAYARYLTRAIDPFDQLTLLLKHGWERSRDALRLEDLVRQATSPAASHIRVVVVDRAGVPVSARGAAAEPQAVTDQDYFIFHRDNASTALRIGKPIAETGSGKAVVHFTRRLEQADGSFDGVVLISVEPSYFAGFYKGSGVGGSGLLAVSSQDGAFRMALTGGGVEPFSNAQAGNALRALPPSEAGDVGVLLSGFEWFADGAARYVSQAPLVGYPLIAIVGISQNERLAAFRNSRNSYRRLALAGSIGLFFFAMVATLLSARLAWRKHQEAEVQNAYRVATEGGNDGFYMLRALRDRNGAVVDFEVVDCNARGAAFYDLTREQFVGAKSSELNSASHFPVLMRTYCSAIESGFYEDELKVPSESPIKVEWVHRRLVRSGTGLAITFRDISPLKAHERELSRMANEDALTGLPNRNWLAHFLPPALEQAKKTNALLALLFVDLDNFKNVNDSLGHSAGDELLRAAALRLRSVLRPSDHVVRLGGDEFTIILHPVLHVGEVAAVALRVTETFHRSFVLSRGQNVVGASVGISLFPADGEDAETLLKNSDIAMYHAKSEGKGQFRFYEPGLSEILRVRLETEHALQQALELNQFVLHYQPRVCTVTGELRAMEALVRWEHPERGMIPPLQFIPLAEETGLIVKLGELVLEQACAQIVQWKARRVPLVPISINVSPYQFNHGDIRNAFSTALARHGLEAGMVEIEITESSMMGEEAEVSAELSALRALGIKLLVDDFGTGYSSLSQLQRLDMDVLKVDRAFTSELGKTAEGEVFFRAIVSMAHALGMIVVAEGVENEVQLRALQSLSCDEIQGFYISRPVPAGEAQRLMQRRFLLPVPHDMPADH